MSNTASIPTSAPSFLDSDQVSSGAPTPSVRAGRGPIEVAASNLEFAEAQLASYLVDRNSVSPDWRDYFDELKVVDSGLTAESMEVPFQAESIFRRSS
ncbi:MAG: 2-oxoglutarate dehydrogenase E1 subunit family protein, partial [Planctomycetaceae bacterium]